MMLIIAVLFFTAILLGAAALYMGYAAVKASPMYELRKRLRKLALATDERLPSDLTVTILREMSPADRFLYRIGVIKRIDKLIDNAGYKLDVKVFIMYVGFLALFGFAVGLLLGRGLIIALILCLAWAAAPFIYLVFQKNKRLTKFTDEFPNALDMVGRSLKAGHSVSSAIQVVASEMAEPVAGLFKTATEEQMLGLSLRDSLANMAERMQSMDLRLFLTAVNLHRDIGGNLAETLERLAHTIRERIKLRRQIKVYTAQGRLTGYILAILPVAMAFFLYLTSPDYLGELVQIDEGKYAIGVVVAGQVVGFLVIKKLINIKI